MELLKLPKVRIYGQKNFNHKIATSLFASRNFEATSVREIAEESGLSVPGME